MKAKEQHKVSVGLAITIIENALDTLIKKDDIRNSKKDREKTYNQKSILVAVLMAQYEAIGKFKTAHAIIMESHERNDMKRSTKND